MTGRRRSSPRPFAHAPAVASTVACTAVIASLFSGCGSLPGASGDSGEKDPVTVMTWAPEGTKATNMPGMPAMAQAYARWVNSQGGIRGHHLRVLTCNERNDSVSAAQCAQRAVDRGAVAVVGSYSQFGRSFMSPLEVKGVPFIGGYGASDEEFESPLSYPVNGGQASLLAGNGRQLARDCSRVALVRPDTIQGDQMPSLLNSGLESGSRHPAKDIKAPEDGTDYSTEVNRALDGVGADPLVYGTSEAGGKAAGSCVTASLGDHTDAFFDSFRRLQEDSPKVRVASVLGSVGQSLVNRTGGKSGPLEGADITGWYPAAGDSRWEPMRKVIKDFAFNDNRIDPADQGAQTTWIAYTVLRSLIEELDDEGIEEITPHALQTALDRGDRAVDTGGLTPKLRWREDDMLAVHDFPRIVNGTVTYQVVRDGELVAAQHGFVNVTKTLERRHTDS
ncbi:ABC transporter substrate-binding protein [Streptomyces sp. Isolate_219]|uniref:ABC transporter substrate-binding protein n=1 Tax=Streptomyces sp. Isolate_219 TaxID=2950110 RepID=UPI0021C99289|nr:ABC transporter substrate-binding protein [Streptomyces sp. Isolate_219]MCR8577967.1 ABC transporter substrate-binding protein [Streptomyces sp. Isolate_219]